VVLGKLACVVNQGPIRLNQLGVESYFFQSCQSVPCNPGLRRALSYTPKCTVNSGRVKGRTISIPADKVSIPRVSIPRLAVARLNEAKSVGGLVLFVCVCVCVCVANKICLEALSETLPCSITEVDCGCNLTAEVDCPESSRSMGYCVDEETSLNFEERCASARVY
jgi:hypothetical protein